MSRKVVPDKGSLNRERPVNQKELFHLKWNGESETECIQRDMVTGMVAGYYQRNGKQRRLS